MVTFIDEWRRKFPSCMVVKRLRTSSMWIWMILFCCVIYVPIVHRVQLSIFFWKRRPSLISLRSFSRVTAFVLRTLENAHQKDWEYRFYLSTDLLNMIGGWLCEQQLPDGTFIEHSPIYDRKLFVSILIPSHLKLCVEQLELSKNCKYRPTMITEFSLSSVLWELIRRY